jgi:hypothetical protein
MITGDFLAKTATSRLLHRKDHLSVLETAQAKVAKMAMQPGMVGLLGLEPRTSGL